MAHEEETQPEPFLLPKQPGHLAQSACWESRKAIATFLRGKGATVQEGDFYTISFVCPYVSFFKKEAEAVLQAVYHARTHGDISETDFQIITDAERLNMRAKVYEAACESAREMSFEDQKVYLWERVVAPIFNGAGFQDRDDPNSPWISFPSDYCAPQRIASQLGLTINTYDDLHGIHVYWHNVADGYDNTFGTPEEISRWYSNTVEPILETLKKVRDAAAATGKTAVDVATKPSLLLPFIFVGGMLWYLFAESVSRKKK